MDGPLGRRTTVLPPNLIDDGQWHRLVCSRTCPTITLRVDGWFEPPPLAARCGSLTLGRYR